MTSSVPVAPCVVPGVATSAPAKVPDNTGEGQFCCEYDRAVASGASTKAQASRAEPARGKSGDAKFGKPGKAIAQESEAKGESQGTLVSAQIVPPPAPAAPIFGFSLGSLRGSDDLQALRELISPAATKTADTDSTIEAALSQPARAFGLRDLLPADVPGSATPASADQKGNVAFTVKISSTPDAPKATAASAAVSATPTRTPLPSKLVPATEKTYSTADKTEPAEIEPAKPAAGNGGKQLVNLPGIQAGAAYSSSMETGTRASAKAEAPAAVQEVGATEAAPASPAVREITLTVGAADQAQATVHVREMAGGQVRVMVHTPSVELTNSLRSELEGLSSRLESAGVKASVTQPLAQSQASSGGSLEHRDSPSTGGRAGEQSTARDPEQGRDQRRAKWMDEMEKRYADQ